MPFWKENSPPCWTHFDLSALSLNKNQFTTRKEMNEVIGHKLDSRKIINKSILIGFDLIANKPTLLRVEMFSSFSPRFIFIIYEYIICGLKKKYE